MVRALVNRPQMLDLTPAQVELARRIQAWVDSLNAPLQQQMQQALGGRTMRDMTPEERQQLMPTLTPIMQQLRANGNRALDSLRAALNPAQQARLDSLRAQQRGPGMGRP